MRIFLLFLLAFSFPVPIMSQIGGITGSKLNSINVAPIPLNSIEFEPTFSTSRVRTSWDMRGELMDLDSTAVSSSICWRFTYGLSAKTEIGFSAPSDFSSGSVGVKTGFLQKEIFSLGGMVGFTIPFGNRVFDSDNRSIDDLTAYGLGLTSTWDFNERTSLDVSLQYQDYFNSVGSASPGSWFINADFGSYVAEQNILLIIGAQYQSDNLDGSDSALLTLTPGIAFEMNERFIIVLNTQHDVYGRKADKSFGMNMSLTTIW